MADGQARANRRAAPWRRRRVATAVLAAAAVLLIGGGAAALYVLGDGLQVTRVPGAFRSVGDTPRPAADSSQTFLLVSTDSRTGEPCDAVMLARIDPGRTRAAIVSIPRDSWVPIPGRPPDTLGSAYATGGPPLLIRTVEQLTALRVDHFAVIDFADTASLVDAVDGIDVGVAEPTASDGVRFRQGVNHLDGAAALAYVRQRDGLPRADLDHAGRQQNVLRALLTEAVDLRLLADPVQIYRLLGAVGRAVSVDESLGRDWVVELRGLRPDEVVFLGTPVREVEPQGGRSVVRLDDRRAADLWQALRRDSAAVYAELNPDDTLGPMPA